MRRRWKWVLAISLALNLLVASALVGAWLAPGRGGPDGPRGSRGGPPEIGALARGLDAEAREALRDALRGDGPVGEARGRIARGELAVLAALRAEPFDAAAFRAALDARQSLQGALATRGFERLAEVVAVMDPERRAAYADRVEAALSRRQPR
ncbi:periplasmic heavy metal sensor [Jannaschia sp. W003]|uniref:periplasmic heavy metal sensor n=1 Tax=Jannaschia sp. W003 TaxID=2867012 RepID=UPI0021A600C0|nr:periplasmic heavy metal sensor [Jannaschia sp. W003]UWQ21160.1 periplasmic heavy metal sensor [Jannaschia sp. W003]